MEGLSITMGRGRLWWYTGAQVTTGQSVEAGYSVVQQVSKSYFDVYICNGYERITMAIKRINLYLKVSKQMVYTGMRERQQVLCFDY